MVVTTVVADDNDTFVEIEYQREQVSQDMVKMLIRQLDGRRHTLVTLYTDTGAHMAIGGSASAGLVVYETADNESFNNLLTGTHHGSDKVNLVAGGQPGDYESRYVVTLGEALTAGTRYVSDGVLAAELRWESG
jgi:hypothetical protein